MDKYCSKYLLKKSNSNTSNLNSLNDSFPIAFNNFDINNSIHSSKYSDSKLNNKFLPGDSPQQTILQPFLQNNNSENRINLINPLASPCAGAPAPKYGDVNTVTTSPGEVKGLMVWYDSFFLSYMF